MTSPQLPAWPAYELVMTDDGVLLDGPAAEPGPYPDRQAAVEAVAALAAALSPPRPVRALAREAGLLYPLAIHPDGTSTATGSPRRPRHGRRLRRTTAPAEPTTPVRRLLSSGNETPHQAPASAPPRPEAGPVGPEAAPPLPAPRASTPAPGPAPTLAEVAVALSYAAHQDAAISAQRGPSDPEALAARVERARLAAVLGHIHQAVEMLRDVAERHLYAGRLAEAEALADRAHALWLSLPPERARLVGPSIIRLRAQVPGPGHAYAEAVQYQHSLAALTA
ncbi:hypothetical protein [Streptomyces sp. NPDC088925]|uniref:hypothetical protein n=1 Tax=Streptomyces sp. NPDC088925 TaxID=3365914 RepID=UPI0037F41952